WRWGSPSSGTASIRRCRLPRLSRRFSSPVPPTSFRVRRRPARTVRSSTPVWSGCLNGLARRGVPTDAHQLRKLIQEFLMSVDNQAATDRLMRFLAIEGVTGKEAAIGRDLMAALRESGVPDDALRLDDANTRIPVPTETGNLIVDLPGRGAMHNQPPILFMTHMDTG